MLHHVSFTVRQCVMVIAVVAFWLVVRQLAKASCVAHGRNRHCLAVLARSFPTGKDLNDAGICSVYENSWCPGESDSLIKT